ncbi:restriction endonuclease subunit S [Marinobacterium iners]|uniref:Type I restriction enzyme, S subunit n=1 Tax=Marinobacterium iners DSM 11526 TaxID=1122198 RepID=A0A1H4GSY0_9GAMM|nr:restriction endonuclease subunit S [Marinobacterium iners]SEB11732.1 type I restriction enzyme, S subunit [Marinobacterium iners DSM 11526]
MGDKRVSTTIGEILDNDGGEIKTGPFGTKLKASEYSSDGVPVISVGEVQLGRIVLHEKTPKVGPDVTNRMPEYLLREGDIVFGRKGAVERSARVAQHQNGWFLGSDGIRVRLPSSCDSRFIAYQFLTNYHRQWMIQHAAGTTMASLNEGIVRRIPIMLAPLSEQRSIAQILGTLDAKIELNRQINETLEQMAQALFKSWFVDFDPVIDNALDAGNSIPEELEARAERRRHLRDAVAQGDTPVPGVPDDISSLFPSEFELTDEMGWIPKGWSISTTHDEFDIKGGSTPSTKNPDFWEDGGIHWTSPKDLSGNNDKVLLDTERKITHQGLDKITSGLLPVNTVLMSSRAPVGYLALARIPVAINQGYIALICEKTITPEYTIQWLSSVMDEIKSIAGGTTFSEVSKKTFRSIKLVVPEEKVVAEYTKYVAEYYQRITQAAKESDSLSAMRDYLLPRLISGELQIPDAEQQIAAAVS